ncbi:hypothetical protein BCR44DRAFT_37274, partial [Catenaria anguillulae PL171]
MRFAPTLEFFVFLVFTVPTARRVLKAQQAAGKQSAASGSISTEATTSNGRTVTGTTSTSFASRSSPGGQSVGSMNDIDLGGKKDKGFMEQFADFFRGSGPAAVEPSIRSQANESQMQMMQKSKSTASN